MLFAYFGPETALPLASSVVTVIGLVLATGRGVTYWFAYKLRAQVRK